MRAQEIQNASETLSDEDNWRWNVFFSLLCFWIILIVDKSYPYARQPCIPLRACCLRLSSLFGLSWITQQCSSPAFEMASSQFSFADDRSDLSSILPKIYVQYVDVQSVVWSGYSTHGIGWNRPLSCHWAIFQGYNCLVRIGCDPFAAEHFESEFSTYLLRRVRRKRRRSILVQVTDDSVNYERLN